MLRLRMKNSDEIGSDRTWTSAMVAHAGQQVNVRLHKDSEGVAEAQRLLCNGDKVPSLMGSAELFADGSCSPPTIFASFTFDDDTEPELFVNLAALDRYVCPPKSGPWAAVLLMMSAANPS